MPLSVIASEARQSVVEIASSPPAPRNDKPFPFPFKWGILFRDVSVTSAYCSRRVSIRHSGNVALQDLPQISPFQLFFLTGLPHPRPLPRHHLSHKVVHREGLMCGGVLSVHQSTTCFPRSASTLLASIHQCNHAGARQKALSLYFYMSYMVKSSDFLMLCC